MNWSSFLGGVVGGFLCVGAVLVVSWIATVVNEFRQIRERLIMEAEVRRLFPPIPFVDPNAPVKPIPMSPAEQAGVDAAIAEAEREERDRPDSKE